MSAGDVLGDADLRDPTPESLSFTGEHKQTLMVAGPQGKVLLVGVGDDPDADGLRLAAGAAARALRPEEPAAIAIPAVAGATGAITAGFLAGSYRYERYRSGGDGTPGELVIVGDVAEDEIRESRIVAEAVYRARDWVNRPSRDKSPEELAAEMGERLDAAGYVVDIWDEGRIREEGLGGLAGVAAGSDRPPRLLIARPPSGAGAGRLALVGKGVVFDSGGLSLKTTDGMETMKGDMAGGAAVVAAAEAIAHLLGSPPLSVYVPLTDNMGGGSAMKPGDVLTIRNGKTIEVLNTDAEGRLTLADALSLAAEAEPELIVDVATLTGASRVALGDRIAGLFASSIEVGRRVEEAADRAGERVWRLPLPADYRALIESSVADMKNTGGRYGGAIAAAILLSEFVGDVGWAHVDIAGPSFFREDHALGPRGGSGFGVATLVALAKDLARV
ncbi:MAG: leucyl aminopeptidase family protein [Actinomycetota bacterium]